MLKKAANITIIILLLVATGGVPVTRHYCGLVQKSVSVYATPKSCCGSGCDKCHNVFKFSKVNDNFEAGSSISAQALSDFVTLHSNFFIDLFNNTNISSLADSYIQRAVDISKAGHSPASSGNFRC
jgi:epoxyqueuosine reductase QueG